VTGCQSRNLDTAGLIPSIGTNRQRNVMTVATALRCLVLNADWRPLATYPLSLITGQEAVRAVYRGRATVAEEWNQVFRSPSVEIRVPKAVALREYAPINAEPKFCRRSILQRDRFRCQYCGGQFQSHELTFDHVIPRASGGQTVWANILSACIECNKLKRDKPVNWSGKKGAGLRPLKPPRQPTTMELLRAGLEFIDPAIKEDFGSWLYWSAELKA
jgi:5-methylcytosine-specific restriction endonuclease McrA